MHDNTPCTVWETLPFLLLLKKLWYFHLDLPYKFKDPGAFLPLCVPLLAVLPCVPRAPSGSLIHSSDVTP